MFRPRAAQTTILAAGCALALITATAGDRARGEGNLDARPIAGTRLLAPFRLSVVSTLANLMIEAIRFEAIMAPAPAGTSPNIAHPSDTSPTREDGGDERCVRVGSGVVVCQKVPEAASKRR
jgi:hypothetical protein